MSDLTTILLSIVVALLVYIYFSYKNAFKFFDRLGLKGPPPVPIFGNFLQFMRSKPWELRHKLVEKYGRVYGVYSGKSPHLVVADVDVLQQITTKDFDSFVNHDFGIISNKYRKKFLIELKDDHWRRVRALMSPTFTSGKIRRMFELLDNCCTDLVAQCHDEASGNQLGIVDTKKLFDYYTMDGIATCCYGFKLQRTSKSNNVNDAKQASASEEFVRDARLVRNIQLWRNLLSMVIPTIFFKFIPFEVYPSKLYEPIASKAAKIIKARRETKDQSKYNDYLQSLLNTNLDHKLELGDQIAKLEDHHAGLNDSIALREQEKLIDKIKTNQAMNKQSKITLTDAEILSSVIFFLTVGIETTGNLLTNLLQFLAWKPDVQEKLYQEIKGVARVSSGHDRPKFEYDSLTSAPYLDAVISETLRYLPIISNIDRMTNADCYIKKLDITIPKGLAIQLNYGCIMTDAEYWPNPNEFNPDRFLPENRHKIVPGSYCPFGLGPRHCIGMRFALTETKLAIARLIVEFKFEPAPDTTFPPKLKGHTAMTWLENPNVRVASR